MAKSGRVVAGPDMGENMAVAVYGRFAVFPRLWLGAGKNAKKTLAGQGSNKK